MGLSFRDQVADKLEHAAIEALGVGVVISTALEDRVYLIEMLIDAQDAASFSSISKPVVCVIVYKLAIAATRGASGAVFAGLVKLARAVDDGARL